MESESKCATQVLLAVMTPLISSMVVVQKVKKPAHYLSKPFMAATVDLRGTWRLALAFLERQCKTTAWPSLFVFTAVCTCFEYRLWPTILYVLLLLGFDVGIVRCNHPISCFYMVALLAVTITNVSR